MNIPKNVNYLMKQLNLFGFKAFIVGGCVRDTLIGKKPNDWDITTNARPDDIKKVFKGYNTIDIGSEYGTIIVNYKGENYDITTYRSDEDYSDGRHPNNIVFEDNIEVDLSRRDFTCNAIAFNPDVGFVDPFMGIDDIKNKVIKYVGNPQDRLEEDKLRALRAFRFAVSLGFDLRGNDLIYSMKTINDLEGISKERINAEFSKILVNLNENHFMYFKIIMNALFPDFKNIDQCTPYHNHDLLRHTFHAVCNIDNDLDLRLVMFFHDFGKSYVRQWDRFKNRCKYPDHASTSSYLCKKIMKDLKYPNKVIDHVNTLILEHDRNMLSKKSIRKFLAKYDENLFCDFLEIRKADIGAQSPEYFEERMNKVNLLDKRSNSILFEEPRSDMSNLKVNGYDMIDLGFKGKDIGNALKKCLDIVLEDPNMNKKELLLNKIKIDGT